MDTGTGHFSNNINAGTGHFGKLGTTPTPVPDASVSSVRHPYRYRAYRYRTEHTLDNIICITLYTTTYRTLLTDGICAFAHARTGTRTYDTYGSLQQFYGTR